MIRKSRRPSRRRSRLRRCRAQRGGWRMWSTPRGRPGAPKGVGVAHGALANYLSWAPSRLGWGTPGGRYGLLQAPVADLGNTTIFIALATGGRGQAVDYLKAVPSHLAALAAGGGLPGVLPARSLVLGGEAAAPGWVAELAAAAADRTVVNHYGATETAVGGA